MWNRINFAESKHSSTHVLQAAIFFCYTTDRYLKSECFILKSSSIRLHLNEGKRDRRAKTFARALTPPPPSSALHRIHCCCIHYRLFFAAKPLQGFAFDSWHNQSTRSCSTPLAP